MRIASLPPIGLLLAGQAAAATWETEGPPAAATRMRFSPVEAEAYAESISFGTSLGEGIGIGVQLTVSNLGWGDRHGAVSSSGTFDGSPLKWSARARWSQDDGQLVFGDTRVEIAADVVRLRHRAGSYACDLVYRRATPAWAPGTGRIGFGSGFYEFALPMPLARVSGWIESGGKRRTVQGWGHIDHSRSNQHAHKQATRWYRFRAVSDGVVLQLARLDVVPEHGGKPVQWLYLAQEGRIAHESFDFDMQLSGHVPDPGGSSYRIPLRYRVRGKGIDLAAEAPRIAARTDYLAELNAVVRTIVKRVAHPVGYGMHGSFQARLSLPGVPPRLAGPAWMSQTFVR